jgi:O-antigen/teichoic acid export membrane protein
MFVVAICRGVLQGLEKFRTLSISFLLEGTIKIILAFTLVYLGFRIYGAIGSLLVTTTAIFFFVISFLKKPKELKSVGSKEIYKYTIPVLISITIITLIQNIDVLLVKHYMDGVNAGLYVATSTLAKIVFFATMSFSFVMFPKVAGKFSTGKETLSVFKKSLLMVSAISALSLLIYLLAPKFIVLLLYGTQYVSAANLLTLLGLSMVMLSFSYLIINYLLSINKFKFIYFLGFMFVLETICIVLFHANLLEIVKILFITNAILLLYLASSLIKNEILPNNSSIQRRAAN